jgi:hypothetical protein
VLLAPLGRRPAPLPHVRQTGALAPTRWAHNCDPSDPNSLPHVRHDPYTNRALYPYSKVAAAAAAEAAAAAKAPAAAEKLSPFNDPDAVILERPFRLPLLCLCRPVVRVRHNTLGYIATVRNPFTFLNWHFDINAPDNEGDAGVPVALPPGYAAGQLMYKVRGSWLQGGLCFPNCPCLFKRTRFEIFAPADTSFATPVGEIQRVFRSCCKSMLLEADSFTARFPADASPEARAAVLAAVILLDTTIFEDDGKRGLIHKLNPKDLVNTVLSFA